MFGVGSGCSSNTYVCKHDFLCITHYFQLVNIKKLGKIFVAIDKSSSKNAFFNRRVQARSSVAKQDAVQQSVPSKTCSSGGTEAPQ